MERMTHGAVSLRELPTLIFIRDIWDTDVFWRFELRTSDEGQSLSCFATGSSAAPKTGPQLNEHLKLSSAETGLVADHPYLVIKTIEFEEPETHCGRRFLRYVGPPNLLLPLMTTCTSTPRRMHNPCGRIKWRGRWSNGDGLWNANWTIELREALGHYGLGEDEFIMECKQTDVPQAVYGR